MFYLLLRSAGLAMLENRTTRRAKIRSLEPPSCSWTNTSSKLWLKKSSGTASSALRSFNGEGWLNRSFRRRSQARPVSAAKAARPSANALPTDPNLAGKLRSTMFGLFAWRRASCSLPASGAPQCPQKRFSDGLSCRHSGQGMCASIGISSLVLRSCDLAGYHYGRAAEPTATQRA